MNAPHDGRPPAPELDDDGARRVAEALLARHARVPKWKGGDPAPDLPAEARARRARAGRILACARELRLGDVARDAEGRTNADSDLPGAPGDVCVELAGVAADLRARGLDGPAERLVAHYAGEADDFELYTVYDALERRIARARGHPGGGAPSAPRPVCVVALGGLVASGKSTLARALAESLACPRVVGDRVRDQLLRGAPGRERHAPWWENVQPDFHERVYAELLRRAELVLRSGRSVVLDACFPRARDRGAARDLAHRHGASFHFVECRVDEATQRRRLAQRERDTGASGWREIARTFAAGWEEADALPEGERRVVDGTRPPAESLASLSGWIPFPVGAQRA